MRKVEFERFCAKNCKKWRLKSATQVLVFNPHFLPWILPFIFFLYLESIWLERMVLDDSMRWQQMFLHTTLSNHTNGFASPLQFEQLCRWQLFVVGKENFSPSTFESMNLAVLLPVSSVSSSLSSSSSVFNSCSSRARSLNSTSSRASSFFSNAACIVSSCSAKLRDRCSVNGEAETASRTTDNIHGESIWGGIFKSTFTQNFKMPTNSQFGFLLGMSSSAWKRFHVKLEFQTHLNSVGPSWYLVIKWH